MMDRRLEKDGTLWFVNRCGGCPERRDRAKGPPICTRLKKVIADPERIMPGCPLKPRS